MVSPFMAFSKGLFQGYNENRQMERQFQYDMQLNDIQLKAKIKEPAHFQIIGEDENGKMTTRNLFEMPDKATYGDASERKEEILTRFYNSTNKEMLDKLEKEDPKAYHNLLARHDNLASFWVKRNTKEASQTNGRVQYTWGDRFALSQGHALGDRFKKIALGQIPMSLDRDKIVHSYTANNGEFYDVINMQEYGPRFENDKNLLINTILNIHEKNGNNFGLGIDTIVSNYVNKYTPQYFQAHADADMYFKNIRFSNGALDQDSRLGLQEIINNPKYQMVFKDSDGSYNIENVHKFLQMGSSSVHRQDSGGPTFTTITEADDYVKSVLNFDKGLEGIQARGDATMMALDTMTQLERLYPPELQRMRLNANGELVDPETNERYNPNTDEGKKMIKERFFTGVAANVVTTLVGALSAEGAWGQISSLVTGAGLEWEGTGGEELQKSKFMDKLKDSAGNISTRAMLQEILIYQTAAALQGGTGGRTISDNDVQRISNALGNTLFSTAEMQYTRLSTLKQMMLRMYEVNQSYAKAKDIQGIKAADLLSQMLIGARLDEMSNTNVVKLITTELEKVPVPTREEIKANRTSKGLRFGNSIITREEDIVPFGYKVSEAGVVTYDKSKDLTEMQREFLNLPLKNQRGYIFGIRKWLKNNPQPDEKET